MKLFVSSKCISSSASIYLHIVYYLLAAKTFACSLSISERLRKQGLLVGPRVWGQRVQETGGHQCAGMRFKLGLTCPGIRETHTIPPTGSQTNSSDHWGTSSGWSPLTLISFLALFFSKACHFNSKSPIGPERLPYL